MIVAGAGGHALELLDLLNIKGLVKDLCFFDEMTTESHFFDKYPILHSDQEVKQYFERDPWFYLGVGNPKIRHQFYERFKNLGGELKTIHGLGASISSFSNEIAFADIFSLCYIGPKVKIGKGSLINTGAQIHHEVSIGEFSEISPGAVLLGRVEVGSFCSIGANATILPKVKIGNNVVVGAGSVVTQDVPDGVKVVGVPGRIT